ncbi:MAG: hypothetical protein ACFCU8_09795 [Thermosynechococcaceae cyanobacterium]
MMHNALKNGIAITLHAAAAMLLLLPLVWFAGGFNVLSLNPPTETEGGTANSIVSIAP